MSAIHKLIKNALYYGVNTLFIQGASLLLIPLWLYILTPNQYGLVALLTTVQTLATFVASCNIHNVFRLHYYHTHAQQRAQLIQTFVSSFLLVSIPVTLLFFCIIPPAFLYLYTTSCSIMLIQSAILSGALQSFISFVFDICILEQKRSSVMLLQIVSTLLPLSVSILLVGICKLGVAGVIAARLSSTLLTALYGYTLLVRFFRFSFQNVPLKTIWSFIQEGAPFYTTTLAGWIFASADKSALAHYATLHEVGIYSLAARVGSLFQIIISTPINYAYYPYLGELYQKKDTPFSQLIRHNNLIIAGLLSLLICASVVGYLIARSFLHLIMPAKFHAALGYIIFIMVGSSIYICANIASFPLQLIKRVAFRSYSLLFVSVLNIALNTYLVPRAGITGCVISTVTCYSIYFLSLLYWSNVRHETTNPAYRHGKSRPHTEL